MRWWNYMSIWSYTWWSNTSHKCYMGDKSSELASQGKCRQYKQTRATCGQAIQRKTAWYCPCTGLMQMVDSCTYHNTSTTNKINLPNTVFSVMFTSAFTDTSSRNVYLGVYGHVLMQWARTWSYILAPLTSFGDVASDWPLSEMPCLP